MVEQTGTRDFFVSYTAVDRDWAEWVAWQLEGAGYSVVMQAWDFQPGENFVVLMRQALDRTDRTVALLSQAYLASPYCTDEWTAAFRHGVDGGNRLLLVRIQECNPPFMLRSQVLIDLVGLTQEDASSRLISGVGRSRQKPAVEPPFPKAAGALPHFPGHGPSISNLPPRNRAFTGRELQLEELHQALQTSFSAAVVPQVTVHGLGGVGKSQLVIDYAYQHASEFDVIWWIAAEQPVTIPGQLAALAGGLGVAEVSDHARMLRGLWDELRRRGRWLLIYDNAELRKDIENYLPPGGRGQVLITSRSTLWGAAPTLRLDVLRREDGVGLLRRRMGAGDDNRLAQISKQLGDLPLALEQAAAYMEATKTTPADYLALLQEHEMELLGLGEPSTTEETVATVWQVSLNRVRAQLPVAEDLLNLCAYLAPDAIPRTLLSAHASAVPDPLRETLRHRIPYLAALSIISRYSLVSLTPQDVSVHRLVQSVTRYSLIDADQQLWAAVALGLIARAFPSRSSDPATWTACVSLLPHALTAIDHADGLGVEHGIVAQLLSAVGVYLWSRSELMDARRLNERALSLLERLYGVDDLAVANGLNNLGLVLWDLVDLEGTRSAHSRALAIRSEKLGNSHPAVAATLNNMGVALWDLAQHAEARSAHEEALAILQRRMGVDHPAVAASLINLANVLSDMGELGQAASAYLRALRILEKGSPDGHDTAGDVRGPESVPVIGELAVARAVLDPSLADLESEHDTAGRTSTVNLAEVRAESILERLSLTTGVWQGGDYSMLAKTIDNLGVVLTRMGSLSDAQRLFLFALSVREDRLGADHPDVGWSLTNLGVVQAKLGALQDARASLERGLAVRQNMLGELHPDVATNMNALGAVLVKLGHHADAQRVLARALSIREFSLGADHPATRTTKDNLGAVGRPSRSGRADDRDG